MRFQDLVELVHNGYNVSDLPEEQIDDQFVDRLRHAIGHYHCECYVKRNETVSFAGNLLETEYVKEELVSFLKDIEDKWSEYKENQWTFRQRVLEGDYEIPDKHEKVEHAAAMLSLKDVFNTDEVKSFHKNVEEVANAEVKYKMPFDPLANLAWAIVEEAMYQRDKENRHHFADYGRKEYHQMLLGRIRQKVEQSVRNYEREGLLDDGRRDFGKTE